MGDGCRQAGHALSQAKSVLAKPAEVGAFAVLETTP